MRIHDRHLSRPLSEKQRKGKEMQEEEGHTLLRLLKPKETKLVAASCLMALVSALFSLGSKPQP